MTPPAGVFLGKGTVPCHLLLDRANRHGLVAGATGTGKTVTLQVLAEGFSAAGVPVFMADVKGDLSGICRAGSATHPLHDRLTRRAADVGLDGYGYRGFPTVFFDLYGEQGHPVRTTVSEMGPLMLARLLELNETQEGVLSIAFRAADDNGLLLLDLKDLRAMMQFVAEHSRELSATYGNVSTASVGAIQRRLLVLEDQGAAHFFGEPALAIADLMRCDASGLGQINVLAADRLMQDPKLYSTFLLWLLSELFEELPEVGDPEKPRLVFFFDEAHLLFADAPRALVRTVEQVVRLIRSKGVGVYFVSQNPQDIPDAVLGQLGNRVQHALRSFTAKDRRAVRAAAENFRENPAFDAREVITELGVGEALVSLLDAKGVPTVVDRALIRPPSSRLGPLLAQERAQALAASPLAGRYDQAVDRHSAFEMLAERARAAAREEAAADAPRRDPEPARRGGAAGGRSGSGRTRQGLMETLARSVARSVGSTIGRRLVRGLLGSLMKGR